MENEEALTAVSEEDRLQEEEVGGTCLFLLDIIYYDKKKKKKRRERVVCGVRYLSPTHVHVHGCMYSVCMYVCMYVHVCHAGAWQAMRKTCGFAPYRNSACILHLSELDCPMYIIFGTETRRRAWSCRPAGASTARPCMCVRSTWLPNNRARSSCCPSPSTCSIGRGWAGRGGHLMPNQYEKKPMQFCSSFFVDSPKKKPKKKNPPTLPWRTCPPGRQGNAIQSRGSDKDVAVVDLE